MKISRPLLVLLFTLATPAFSADLKGNWKLQKAEMTYTVTHPLHVVHGTSSSARGEGRGNQDGTGNFLVAVPVRSFDSGDANRDLHMQEVTKAGLYPLIILRAKLAKIPDSKEPKELIADLDIEFAGEKVHYPGIPLKVLDWKEGSVSLNGSVSLSLKAFKITPPSLLAMPVHDLVPVKWEIEWNRSSSK